ncbi:hypothetical protein [Pseudosulfitobacter sp. SM2401]|uniref:hypothetical protein n=1 Tax=Pseudosulfitobacter sp. SM2401 TaxID=3350098 RepID=UPI0036F436A0
MSDTNKRQKIFEAFEMSAAGCCSNKYAKPFGLQLDGDMAKRVLDPPQNGDGGGGQVGLPEFDLSSRDWRDACLQSKMEVPAGYTYFGQLIGHDLGHSVPLAQVPHTERPRDVQMAAQTDFEPTRYNIIENPLTLGTLYGAGPVTLHHLFDPKTYLFRIKRRNVMTHAHVGGDASVRALYDSRNRDTHVLHRLTAILMKFHNQVARRAYLALESDGQSPKNRKETSYVLARAHVLEVWHHLIVTDFLPQFVHPDVMALSTADLESYPLLGETSLLHGVMRAFHALPRRKYKFPELRKLSELLLASPEDDERIISGWPLDWSLFFDGQAGGTKTGVCASFSPKFAPVNGISIAQLDLATARITGALKLQSTAVAGIRSQMPPEWSNRLSAAVLAQEFTSKHASAFDWSVDAADIRKAPLFLILMIEAQLYGDKGGFGHLGSIMLRRTVMHAIGQVRFTSPAYVVADLPRPNSMLELISMTDQ